MKTLLSELKDRLDSLHKSIDYRLVPHQQLSAGVAALIKTLKALHFDQYPEESNKILKHSLFKLIIQSYSQMLSLSFKSGRYSLHSSSTTMGYNNAGVLVTTGEVDD